MVRIAAIVALAVWVLSNYPAAKANWPMVAADIQTAIARTQ